MRLRNKINLYTAVLFAVLLLIINLTVYFSFSQLIMGSERNVAKNESAKITTEVGKSLDKIPQDELLRSYVPINGMIQLVTNNNTAKTATSSSEQQLRHRKPIFYKGEFSQIIKYQKRTYAFESMPIVMENGSVANLQVTKSIQSAMENLTILRVVLLIVTLLALIPVMISSRFLSNLITIRVTSMIKTMTEIRQSGHFKRLPLEERSKDELYQMGETFNHMIDLLETNFEKQQQFVSNASHELKTPITIIESYASLLMRRGLQEPELFKESVEAIHSEAVRMKEMTEQLLLLAKHSEQWNIQMTSVNLGECVNGSVKAFMNAYKRDISFQGGEKAFIVVESDEHKLKQLLFIFLDNARKYSDDRISVQIGVERAEAYIKISDKGIGIGKEELPKVFDRFYRVDKARGRKKGGSGLGLSLAKEIADAIGVRISLESDEGVGTTATLFIKRQIVS
jgi:two-component system, OmpR family, sensor histidine kinase ArlS